MWKILWVSFLFSICKGEQFEEHFTFPSFENDSVSDLCPDPFDIYPCICTVEDYDINIDCSSVVSEAQLKEIFAQNFTGTDARKLTIKDNNLLTTLHDDVFGSTQFIEVEVTGSNIAVVEIGAFRGSYERAVVMKFRDNKLVSFPFEEIDHFTHLESLDVTSNVLQDFKALRSDTLKDFFIGNNMISSISSLVLVGLPQLERFRAGRNPISVIEKETFSNLKYLQEVDYTANSLTQIPSETFIFNGTVTALYLSYNKITTVETSAFEGVTSSLSFASNSIETLEEEVWRTSLENHARLSIEDNPLKCECDIAWLIREDDLLARVFKGATCAEGTLIHELDPADFDICP